LSLGWEIPSEPARRVEFPIKVKGLFRPHYLNWSEQQRIEFQAPEYLRNIISDHHRDRVARVQGAEAYEEGTDRSGECGSVDS
jgi:hypothetical protein